jgi:cell wall assembly regulator SMI1
MGVLTSVATASESRADITSPYADEAGNRLSTALERAPTAYEGHGPASPTLSAGRRPYSPGMRSDSARRDAAQNDGFETQGPAGEIPMQSFQDGLPPPPPAGHSWSRINKWAEEHYPELYDQICEGCTANDLNELEHQLDCSLPQDVRESLQVHDGQERGGNPTGIIFGAMLLDCEEIVQEWEQWRRVNQEFLVEATVVRPAVPVKALGGGNAGEASSSRQPPAPQSPNNGQWRQDLQQRQDCVPPNAVRKAYAHPAWIPLVRDWGGNNLAIDLAPGPAGTWGQVIMFGRDYDTKYVVARSWGAFLALVADDLNSGKWFIDEDSNELKLREFKTTRVEPGYFDILRWRMDQKYGRRVAKRKSVAPGTGSASPTGSMSPYASPTEPNGDIRGRPIHRLGGGSPLASPNRPAGTFPKPSPLARVTEESTILPELTIPNGKPREKLVEVDTPRPSDEENVNLTSRLIALTNGNSMPEGSATAREPMSAKANGKQPAVTTSEETMKTIEI